jgi:hypothetical protein
MKEQDQEELKRCEESPAYFYNKYCKPEGAPDVTDEQMKGFTGHYTTRSRRSPGQTSRNAEACAMASKMGKTCAIATPTEEGYNKFHELYIKFGGDPKLISWLKPKAKMAGLFHDFNVDIDYPEEMVVATWPKIPDIPGKAIITSIETTLNGNKFQELWNDSDPINNPGK